MTPDTVQPNLEVPVPLSMARKKLLVRAWMATDEPAPTWNGELTIERALRRGTSFASEQTLIYRGNDWNRPRCCLLREFAVPAGVVRGGANQLAFAEGADARGEISVGTTPTRFGMCGRTRCSRETASLDGDDWRFQLVEDYAAGEGLRLSGFEGVRESIEVPANWEMKGFSKPTYGQWRDESPTVGMYLKTFKLDVPEGMRAHLALDGSSNNTAAWIGGRWIGEHESGFTAFEYDVTDALRKGENDLVLRVDKYPRSAFFENAGQIGYWYLGGVFRSVSIYLTPATYVSGFRTDSVFSADFKSARVTVTAELSTTVESACKAAVKAILVGPNGKQHEGASQSVTLPSASGIWLGRRLVQIEVDVPDVAPWSAETPNLYTLQIELSDSTGKRLDTVEEKIGLREIRIDGQLFKVNGVPIKLRGMCRHDFSPTDGYATKPDLWKRDLDLMREAGVNAVRCSHYSPAEGFIRLCDELGFYVVHEAAAMWVGENADTWYPEYHVRTQETLRRDMNRACVLLWGLGNEHSDTVNFRRAALFCRRSDSRPVVYAGSADELDGDVWTPHYVGKRLAKYVDRKPQKPTICTEDFTQSRGWWPRGDCESFTDTFKSYWDETVLPEDRINGMFIWEWDDRAVVYKNELLLSNTVGYEINSYESQVGPWRRTNLPWFNLLKEVYAPLRVDAEPNDAGIELVVRNQYDFISLGQSTLSYTIYSGLEPVGEKRIAQGEADLALAPRSRTSVPVGLPERDADDWRTVQVEITSNQEFVLSKTLSVPPTVEPGLDKLSAVADSPRIVGPADGQMSLKSTDGEAFFSEKTGAVKALVSHGRRVDVAGLVPNLWITPPGGSLGGGFPDRKDSLDCGNLFHSRPVVVPGEQPAVVAKCTLNHAANPVDLDATYTLVKAGLLIRFQIAYEGRGAKVPAVGVRFTLPAAFTSWRWRGYGPWATYPNLVLGAAPGEYEAPIVAKRRVGAAIPMSEEHLVGQWEEQGGTKSSVDRFCLISPDAAVEVTLGQRSFVECERIADGVEVRVNLKVAEVGDRQVQLEAASGEILIHWPKS